MNRHTISDFGIVIYAAAFCDWEFLVWLVLYLGADVKILTPDKNNALRFVHDFRITKFLVWQGCDPRHRNKDGQQMTTDYIYYYDKEFHRRRILVNLHQDKGTILHKDLWREVVGWIF